MRHRPMIGRPRAGNSLLPGSGYAMRPEAVAIGVSVGMTAYVYVRLWADHVAKPSGDEGVGTRASQRVVHSTCMCMCMQNTAPLLSSGIGLTSVMMTAFAEAADEMGHARHLLFCAACPATACTLQVPADPGRITWRRVSWVLSPDGSGRCRIGTWNRPLLSREVLEQYFQVLCGREASLS